MSDVSDEERSPRMNVGSSGNKKAGDSSVKSMEVPPVYRLASSDSTGAQVIGCTLNGDNYLTWSRAMLIALRARNKLAFIDGTLERPGDDDPLRERWERCNSTVLAWMFNTMEGSLQATVAYAVDARSLWEDLKERFSEGNQSRVFQIKTDICLLKQEGSNVRDYYGKLKLLWDELEFYLEHLGCSCGASGTIAAQRETEKCYQFLMGLTSDFNTIRSTILSIEPLPNLNKVYKVVANEERQKMLARRETIPESAVFLVKDEAEHGKSGMSRLQSFRERGTCGHCGKLGHGKNNCWALIGYPTWHPKSKSNTGKWAGQGQSKQSSGPRGKAQVQRGPDRANAA
ncbi:hypothetical protein CRG98_043386 [Punica granatum]|uniref:Retrotransposon Copia-like N-terminal domain-containing protein n=1 Tax=Punica granatum TaxID=22663 RepID=A0A2I0HWZ8_PUNGR|nr:hypothetical protein CRG98_043386 [Punica granatum]